VFRLRWRIGEGQGGLLNHAIGGGQSAFVLPKVFLPGSDAEDFDEPVRTLTLSVELPAVAPVRRRDRRSLIIASRKASFRSGATVKRTATSTGPVSGSGSKASSGSVQ
jgi:hypothetical protein